MIRISTDVFCDKCSEWEHFCTAARPRIRDARKYIVKEKHWKRIRIGGEVKDICPRCYVKLQEEQKATLSE